MSPLILEGINPLINTSALSIYEIKKWRLTA